MLSELLNMFLNYSTQMADLPSYLGYAAYCSLAIQIPFLSCSNPVIRERAQQNAETNMRVIRGLGRCWKFMGIYVSAKSHNPTASESIIANVLVWFSRRDTPIT